MDSVLGSHRSGRLPSSLEPSAWARRLAELRSADVHLYDFTEMNPTIAGLTMLGEDERAALNHPGIAYYEPHPLGLLEARQAVAAYYAERGTPVSPEAIGLTSGTSESYAHLFRLLADPGDVVLVPSPSYPLLESIAALEGLRVVPYRLVYDQRWSLDLDSLQAAIVASQGRARALITVEPNHPTGSCLSAEERAAVERLCATHELALISDEVFADFPWPPSDRPLPGWLGDRAVPTFVLGGLSKSCGLPQLKLGWIAVAGPESKRRKHVSGLEWIADLFLSVATPVQLACPRLLENRHGYIQRVRTRLKSRLETLSFLTSRHPGVEMLAGEGGWSAILRLPTSRSEDWSLALLQLETPAVVHPAHFYDMDDEALAVVSLIVPRLHLLRRALLEAGIIEP